MAYSLPIKPKPGPFPSPLPTSILHAICGNVQTIVHDTSSSALLPVSCFSAGPSFCIRSRYSAFKRYRSQSAPVDADVNVETWSDDTIRLPRTAPEDISTVGNVIYYSWHDLHSSDCRFSWPSTPFAARPSKYGSRLPDLTLESIISTEMVKDDVSSFVLHKETDSIPLAACSPSSVPKACILSPHAFRPYGSRLAEHVQNVVCAASEGPDKLLPNEFTKIQGEASGLGGLRNEEMARGNITQAATNTGEEMKLHNSDLRLTKSLRNLKLNDDGKRLEKVQKPKTSQYRGVSLFKRTGRWEATIWSNGRQLNLGNYAVEEAAARAYDKAVLVLKSGNPMLNFNKADYDEEVISEWKNMEIDEVKRILQKQAYEDSYGSLMGLNAAVANSLEGVIRSYREARQKGH